MKNQEKKRTWSFSFHCPVCPIYRYVLSTNNAYVAWASNRGYHRNCKGELITNLNDKNFFEVPFSYFWFICSNLPAAATFGMYICQLIWYYIASASNQHFIDKEFLVPNKYSTKDNKRKDYHHRNSIFMLYMTNVFGTVSISFLCHGHKLIYR